MRWKKIGNILLFPHIAVLILLIPITAALLIFSLVFLGTEAIVTYLAYLASAYTLMVWCFRIPKLIQFFKVFRNENKYVLRWQNDANLRITVSLCSGLIWNAAYGVLQLGLGIYHATFWFYSLAGYYMLLAGMRFFLLRHIRKYRPGEQMRKELIRYRNCGIAFLVMNPTLSLMIFFMVYWNRTFHHHEITTIALAAYTFASFAMAIINVIRYRKYNSPVYSASKAISLAAACVSMITLESTMLTTFNDGTITLLGRKILLGISGGFISVFIIGMAVLMIVQSNKKLKLLKYSKGANE